VPRRAWIGQVANILLGVQKLEGATPSQAVVVHIVRYFLLLVGALITGTAIFGRAPQDWLDLFK
jgi:hypothetical protein